MTHFTAIRCSVRFGDDGPLELHFPDGVLRGKRMAGKPYGDPVVDKMHYLCWLCLLFAVGCRPLPVHMPQGEETPLHSGETITITRSGGSSTPGTIYHNYTWEFRPTGECRYFNSSQMVARNDPPIKSESQWQSKTDYERCFNLLQHTNFSRMSERQDIPVPGGSYSNVEVVCGDKKYQISFSSGQPPKGIASLMSFLDTCTKGAESKVDR